MRIQPTGILLLILFFSQNLAAQRPTPDQDLSEQVNDLTLLVHALREELNEIRAEQRKQSDLAVVAPSTSAGSSPDTASTSLDTTVVYQPQMTDLSLNEQTSIGDEQQSHVLANPWWPNFEIHGFAAAGYYKTGSAATRENGGFEIKEAALFVEADIWKNLGFFLELQTNRLGRDSDQFTRTGEVYFRTRDIALGDFASFGFKLGRIDIPFGEEYLRQDAIDNPLITNSAAWVYGTDEGVALFGDIRGVDWIVSVTDGQLRRSIEDTGDKAVNLKLSGTPVEPLYLSFSAMRTGDTSLSALQFGGSFIQPIGGFGQRSTVGRSSGKELSANLVGADAIYNFPFGEHHQARLSLSYGAAWIEEEDSMFDRDLRWLTVEPYFNFNSHWYVVLRYSEIGTYDDDEGWHFSGKTFAGGNSAFGFDTRRFQRLALGLGWTPNPRVKAKLEIGQDWFDTIDASPVPTRNGDRGFLGLEFAAGF